MKKQANIFFSLLLAGCMVISACGQAKEAQSSVEQADSETENSAAETDGNFPDGVSDNSREPSDNSLGAESGENAGSSDADVVPGLTQEEAKEPVSGEVHSVTGIITDASGDSISIQTPDGDIFSLTIPDTGVTGNLRTITVGQIVVLGYTGSLDENHASLTDISASSMVTGIYTEEYAFAIKIIEAVREMSIPKLRELINFPLFIDTGTYAGPMNDDVFRGMDTEQVFTEELVDRIAFFNLFNLQYTYAGFVMGDGGPNITFSVDDDGILGIIGINCTKIPTSSVSGNSSETGKKSEKDAGEGSKEEK